jgi:restriction system protein
MTFVSSSERDLPDPQDGNRADERSRHQSMSDPKCPPTSRARAVIFLKAALEELDRAGGAMRFREMLTALSLRVRLIPFDYEVHEKSGHLRWHNLIRLFSINYVRAGFLRKRQGRWELTPEGRAHLALPAEEIYVKARRRYRDWKAAQQAVRNADAIGDAASAVETRVAASAGAASAGAASADATPRRLLLETVEGSARTEIEGFVSEMSPYHFQDLIAALLRAMGYTIAFVSPQGTDGGTDILAYRDPLGVKTPHMRVQVKHRNDKARREEVAALRGIIRQGREIGLFVSSGGFTADAVREARHGAVHIELMDWDGVLDKWLAHYERLKEKDRRRLRLRPVYFLASE